MRSIIFIIILNLLFISCTKDNDPVQPTFDDRNTIEIFAYDYSQNHYFVDSIYASTNPELNIFNSFYGNEVSYVNDKYRIKEIEVWKTIRGYIDPARERKVNAFINIPSKGAGHYPLDSPMREQSLYMIPGESIIGGRFIRLEENIDYEINNYCGLLSFK